MSVRETGAVLVATYENNSELSTRIMKGKAMLAVTSKVMLAVLMKMADMNMLSSVPHSCYSLLVVKMEV
jgi:hypothetical protein